MSGLDEGAHERGQSFDIIIDAGEQHALTEHRDACIDQSGAGCARRCGQFARMIGMQGDVDRLAGGKQNVDKLRR